MLKGIAMLLCSVGDIVGSIPTRSTMRLMFDDGWPAGVNPGNTLRAIGEYRVQIPGRLFLPGSGWVW